MSSSVVALGIDWYRRGWVGVALTSPEPTVVVGDSLDALIARFPDAPTIGVDMPIGLPEVRRPADELARDFVGPRRSSVFPTPPRAVLAAASYPEANLIAPAILGGKIS